MSIFASASSLNDIEAPLLRDEQPPNHAPPATSNQPVEILISMPDGKLVSLEKLLAVQLLLIATSLNILMAAFMPIINPLPSNIVGELCIMVLGGFCNAYMASLIHFNLNRRNRQNLQ